MTKKLENPEMVQIYKDVFAFINLFHVSRSSTVNSGLIVTENSLIFIDSGMRIESARFIWKESLKNFPDKKNIYLILTHHHSDHSFGMKVFKENGAKIISHKNCCEFLSNDNGKYKDFVLSKFFRNREIGEKILGDVQIYTPDILVEGDKLITVDDIDIKLLYTPGHTQSDVCVYHPDSKILFAGDTIYENSPPNTRFGNIDLWKVWIKQLKRLEDLEISSICPGHGNITHKKVIESNINYLKQLINT